MILYITLFIHYCDIFQSQKLFTYLSFIFDQKPWYVDNIEGMLIGTLTIYSHNGILDK